MVETGRTPGKSFIAAAPRGLSLHDLGKPFTADFQRLQGEEGKTLLPHAGPLLKSVQGAVEHAFVIVESEQELAANASAWGFGGEVNASKRQRYASYRAVQIREVYEVDDTTRFRTAPPNATYYPWRIYVGHSYEMLFSGDVDTFSAGVKSQLLKWEAGIDGFTTEYHLEYRSVGHGLQPGKAGAIFAKTREQIENAYINTDEPAVILVEWREIPGRSGTSKPIEWNEVREGCPGQSGCQPCQEWAFDKIEWSGPAVNRFGEPWDIDGSDPDVVLMLVNNRGATVRTSPQMQTLRYRWEFDSRLIIKPGNSLFLISVDKDFGDHEERINNLSAKVHDFHVSEGGVVKVQFGNGQAFMTGICIRP